MSIDNQHFQAFTPSSASLFLKADVALMKWYAKSEEGEDYEGGTLRFFERAGKALLTISVNLVIATAGTVAGIIYDLAMSVIWGLAALFTKFDKQRVNMSFLGHLSSLGSAPLNALNHILAITPGFHTGVLPYNPATLRLMEYGFDGVTGLQQLAQEIR